ncbi:hypothetical protein O988_07676, partial [Pseudogymnoascus sp. VKM F-3808]
VSKDIMLDMEPETREVEVFELQKLDSRGEWEPWLYSASPYDPLAAPRIANERPRGTQFFEDVAPPRDWEWSEKKWNLDLWSREWVEERIITGVEVETEGERQGEGESEAEADVGRGCGGGGEEGAVEEEKVGEVGEEGCGDEVAWGGLRWCCGVGYDISRYAGTSYWEDTSVPIIRSYAYPRQAQRITDMPEYLEIERHGSMYPLDGADRG